MTSGVYQIKSNIKPERTYIGSAVDIKGRWRTHLSNLRKNKHGNARLQNHYNKYGKSDLQFSILLGCEKEDLLKTEQYFIDSYNPYFNICKTAGSQLGLKRSEETKLKMRGNIAWNKGEKMSDETKRKMSESAKRRKASDETKRKIGLAKKGNKYCLGKKLTDERKKQIAIRMKGHIASDSTKQMIALKNSLTKNTEEGRRKMQEAWNKRRINKLKAA